MTLRTILSSASLPSVSTLRLLARPVVVACLVTLVYPLAAQAQALSKSDIENLAAYYASLPGSLKARR